MSDQQILEELLELLENNGAEVRREPLGGRGGGLCTVKGQKLFFVDTEAPLSEALSLCADAVAQLVDIERIYLKPRLRHLIENHRASNRHTTTP